MSSIRTSAGHPYPMGATVTHEGINFALFSRNATAIFLELYHDAGDARPYLSIELDPERNRTGDVWHVLVHGIGSGQLYGYQTIADLMNLQSMKLNKFKSVASQITVRSDVFTIRCYASADVSGATLQTECVVDRGQSPCTILYSHQGANY